MAPATWRRFRMAFAARRHGPYHRIADPADAGEVAEAASEQAAEQAAESPSRDPSSGAVCWICFDSDLRGLTRPCSCPNHVHGACLARWQLRRAGRAEETACRFCSRRLPDWRESLTPAAMAAPMTARLPVMAVHLDGVEHRFTVRPGTEGRRRFQAEIRERYDLASDAELEVTFKCEEPAIAAREGSPHAQPKTHVTLDGLGAYDAAFHCASVTAAERSLR